jgi:TRAP-type C4-dicarboxylate transport system substrate-binding protein
MSLRGAVGPWLLTVIGLLVCIASTRADEPVRLNVVGGLAGVSQYTKLEEPFWRERIEALSHGRIQATIQPFDRSGFRGEEMLPLMRLGVIPFGTALLGVAAADEPELNAVDLPGVNPDFATLQSTLNLSRPHIRQILEERYGIELLGLYAYPAQVLFCTAAFRGLDDLRGRRVRTSSVAQSNLISAVGGVPVRTPFAGIVDAVKAGTLDCAITGTLSGNEIGLTDVTKYIHSMAINWGVSLFGANRAVWNGLPGDVRESLRDGITQLERMIWDAANQETFRGLACDTGAANCEGHRGQMIVVPVTPTDDARRKKLLVDAVLPAWLDRCGPDCAEVWNQTLAPSLGILATAK